MALSEMLPIGNAKRARQDVRLARVRLPAVFVILLLGIDFQDRRARFVQRIARLA